MWKKTKSFGGKIFLGQRYIALLKETKKCEKKTKSFGGKIILREKSLRF